MIVMLIPIVLGLLAWSIRSRHKEPSINEVLFLNGELIEDVIERKRKERYGAKHTPNLEHAYLKNLNHPEWVVRVWFEQGKIDSDGNYKE